MVMELFPALMAYKSIPSVFVVLGAATSAFTTYSLCDVETVECCLLTMSIACSIPVYALTYNKCLSCGVTATALSGKCLAE